MRRVHLDSRFVIYLTEETPRFSVAARHYFSRHAVGEMCVSPLVRLEVLTRPMRDGNTALLMDDEDFLASLGSLPINDEVFDHALSLRASHRLKTPDALHLATAQYHGCGEIWTNDDRLNDAAVSMSVNVLPGIR